MRTAKIGPDLGLGDMIFVRMVLASRRRKRIF